MKTLNFVLALLAILTLGSCDFTPLVEEIVPQVEVIEEVEVDTPKFFNHITLPIWRPAFYTLELDKTDRTVKVLPTGIADLVGTTRRARIRVVDILSAPNEHGHSMNFNLPHFGVKDFREGTRRTSYQSEFSTLDVFSDEYGDVYLVNLLIIMPSSVEEGILNLELRGFTSYQNMSENLDNLLMYEGYKLVSPRKY
jgi:hypothetical protein